MIHIVTTENKERYALWLDEMFAQRKRVFVDELGWALHHEQGREIDAFDTDDAIYLLNIDEESGLLKASARLLPSTSPHLLNDVFPDLCEGDVPWGPNIWEASRFCPAPATPKGDAR